MTLDQWLFLSAFGWIIALGWWTMFRSEKHPDGACARMWDALGHGLFGAVFGGRR
jgi:hypothetical protein